MAGSSGNGNRSADRRGRKAHPINDAGTLIIIGGHEDKEGEKVILKEVARRVGEGKLVITTVASHEPAGLFEQYRHVFLGLGVRDVANLMIHERAEACKERAVNLLDNATCLFFTGGDQLRITSQIGDTPIFSRILELYERGGIVAGTSAGASVVCETMLVGGGGRESHRMGDNLRMAPGLGLLSDAIIDQHFAERGRMGRLLAAVAQNPRMLGIGIDEDTAIVLHKDLFEVLGSGAVYVVDGTGVSHSNITEEQQDVALSIHDVKLHVLSQGECFDMQSRRPIITTEHAEAIEDRHEAEAAR
jgi:cyanophycinase